MVEAVRSLGTLSSSSLQIMAQLLLNRKDAELVDALVSGTGGVAEALVRVAHKSEEVRSVSYVLCFLADLVFLSKSFALEFCRVTIKSAEGTTEDAAHAALSLLSKFSGNITVTNPSLFLFGVAMRYSSAACEQLQPLLASFFSVLHGLFTEAVLQVPNVEYAVRACVQVARRKDLRQAFFARDPQESVMPYIPRLLTEMMSGNASSILQLTYDTLLLAWLLSYEYLGVVQLQENHIIPHLLRVLQRTQKEKCLRLALMVLGNMGEAERRYLYVAQHPVSGEWVDEKVHVLSQLRRGEAHKGPVLLSEMVSVGMQKTLLTLKRRNFADEDITALIDDISRRLEESMETITSFSEYRGEVLSGALDWSPLHTSTKFWKEHSLSMEANNYEVLIALGSLILNTRDLRTLAVACHDLGETVRYHPTGRSLLLLPSMRGVKEHVISLMSHTTPEIAKEALLCTQKIMVQQWEYIS